jgi:hypothetical protein
MRAVIIFIINYFIRHSCRSLIRLLLLRAQLFDDSPHKICPVLCVSAVSEWLMMLFYAAYSFCGSCRYCLLTNVMHFKFSYAETNGDLSVHLF